MNNVYPQPLPVFVAYVATNGESDERMLFRTMKDGFANWTGDIDKALQFARRYDAELFCEQDEDAWQIMPIALTLFGAVLVIVDVVIHCPQCGAQHIDDGEWAARPHRSHLCSNCGHIWRVSDVFTRGVRNTVTHGHDDGAFLLKNKSRRP